MMKQWTHITTVAATTTTTTSNKQQCDICGDIVQVLISSSLPPPPGFKCTIARHIKLEITQYRICKECHEKGLLNSFKLDYADKEKECNITNLGKHVLQTPSKDHVTDDGQLVGLIQPHSKGRRSVRKTKKRSWLLLPSAPQLLENSSGTKNGQNFNLKDKLLNKIKLYRQYFPAPDVVWKGSIWYSDSSTVIEFGNGFQASPPHRMLSKALELSKKLPSILQIEPLPRRQSLFPDFQDIALYFFPAPNVERSKLDYDSLFALMESKKSAMRACIDKNIELLLFTSKQLPVKTEREFSFCTSKFPPVVSLSGFIICLFTSDCCTITDGNFCFIDVLGSLDMRIIYGVFRAAKKNQAPPSGSRLAREDEDMDWTPSRKVARRMNLKGQFGIEKTNLTCVLFNRKLTISRSRRFPLLLQSSYIL
ncbi:hypothetical protein ACFE04_005578 [Oxalis oulophora]